MGLFSLFQKKPAPTILLSILPDAAKQEIIRGNLPILKTNRIFLKAGEQCHYIDKAIFEKRTIRKRYVRKNVGYSMTGLFKGSHINMGSGNTEVTDNVLYESFRGILYITNKHIIFVGEDGSFDKRVDELIAISPYSNCIDLHFSSDKYRVFVPDGNIVNAVLQLL